MCAADVLNVEVYEAFLNKRATAKMTTLDTDGREMTSKGEVVARWEEDIIHLPREVSSHRMTRHRNMIVRLAKSRGIKMVYDI